MKRQQLNWFVSSAGHQAVEASLRNLQGDVIPPVVPAPTAEAALHSLTVGVRLRAWDGAD
jgi:hypothetical protein